MNWASISTPASATFFSAFLKLQVSVSTQLFQTSYINISTCIKIAEGTNSTYTHICNKLNFLHQSVKADRALLGFDWHHLGMIIYHHVKRGLTTQNNRFTAHRVIKAQQPPVTLSLSFSVSVRSLYSWSSGWQSPIVTGDGLVPHLNYNYLPEKDCDDISTSGKKCIFLTWRAWSVVKKTAGCCFLTTLQALQMLHNFFKQPHTVRPHWNSNLINAKILIKAALT